MKTTAVWYRHTCFPQWYFEILWKFTCVNDFMHTFMTLWKGDYDLRWNRSQLFSIKVKSGPTILCTVYLEPGLDCFWNSTWSWEFQRVIKYQTSHISFYSGLELVAIIMVFSFESSFGRDPFKLSDCRNTWGQLTLFVSHWSAHIYMRCYRTEIQ